MIDDHSRLLWPRPAGKAADVVAAFHRPPQPTAIPAACSATTAPSSPAAPAQGKVALELDAGAAGHRLGHSRPYHPQTCGKVERFHQTLKSGSPTSRPRPPPRAAGASSTASALLQHPATPPRAGPTHPRRRPTPPAQGHPDRAIGRSATPALRHDTVDPSGTVTLRYDSRLHHIGLGRRHAGTRVLVLADDRQHPDPRPRHRRVAARADPGPQPRLPAPRTTTRAPARSPATRTTAAAVKAGRRPPEGPRPGPRRGRCDRHPAGRQTCQTPRKRE